MDRCSESGEYLLVVHSGSRALGQAIYRHWSARCHSASSSERAEGDKGGLDVNEDEDVQKSDFDAKIALSVEDTIGYVVDMILAQQYARINRIAILSSVLASIATLMPTTNCGGDEISDEEGDDGQPATTTLFSGEQVVSSVHNYIDFDDMVLRKGAIRCHANEACIVALNMRDGVWLCVGKGNPEWNFSGPHGCGRILDRSTARGGSGGGRMAAKKKSILLKQFEQEMGNVVCSCVNEDTLDERPSAYRDASVVQSAVGETLTIQKHFITVVSAKGGT